MADSAAKVAKKTAGSRSTELVARDALIKHVDEARRTLARMTVELKLEEAAFISAVNDNPKDRNGWDHSNAVMYRVAECNDVILPMLAAHKKLEEFLAKLHNM
jgi:hypothetical protein